jgi:hypothetical protein
VFEARFIDKNFPIIYLREPTGVVKEPWLGGLEPEATF